jgi:hypothetical protein
MNVSGCLHGPCASFVGAPGLGVPRSNMARAALPPSIWKREPPANTLRTRRALHFRRGFARWGHP